MRKSTVVDRAFYGFRDFEALYEECPEHGGGYAESRGHPYILEDASESGIVDHFRSGARASALVLDEGGMLKARLDNQRMCKRFDGGDLRVLRNNKMTLVRDPRTTFCMTIQDSVFNELLKSKEGKIMVASGLMPRILLSYATHSVPYANVPKEIEKNPFVHTFHERVRALMSEYSCVFKGIKPRKQVTLSSESTHSLEDASSHWKFLAHFDQRWKGLEAFLHRAGEQAMRVAAVLQCFNDPQLVVQKKFMDYSIKIVNWHLNQALSGLRDPAEEEIQFGLSRELYGYILKKNKSESQTTFLRVDLLRKGPANLRKADKLDLAIDQLILEDKIAGFPEGQRKYIVLNLTPNPRRSNFHLNSSW